MLGPIKLFSGTSNIPLAKEIGKKLNKNLGKIEIKYFADGEIFVQIQESVRGLDVFVIQPTSTPVNQNLMELLIIIDALKRASAGRITAVIPYYGYSRQDRKDKPRVPITAKLVADLLEASGVNRILTVELHSGQIQGFFNIPVDNLYSAPVILSYIKSLNIKDLVIVSPDAGGLTRARALSKRLGTNYAIVEKRRFGMNQVEAISVIGDVNNKNVLLVDDMIDTAGTICKAAKILKEKGAKKIYVTCVHPVLSPPAMERINKSDIEHLIVTNTINQTYGLLKKKVEIISMAKLLAEVINRIHNRQSVSCLFDTSEQVEAILKD